MTITKEQSEKIKEELRKQLTNLPEEKREEVKNQIETMTDEQLESLLKQNQQELDSEASKCIFCSIVNGTTKSIKVDENEEALAVMDINPISKGHVLVIPKDHEKEPSEKTQELAFSVGGRILEKLSPKDITTRAAKVMDHTILNVIPIYDDTDFEKRIEIKNEEILEISSKISTFVEKEIPKIKSVIKNEELPKEPSCIFCSIINKSSPSFKIDENKENIAILEISPVSIGHTLIIPRIHDETTKLPQSTFSLSKKIAKKITSKYKPNNVKINPVSINNHALIELIPIYENTDPSKKLILTPDELENIQKNLEVQKKPKNTKKKTAKVRSKIKKISLPKRKYPSLHELPPRIP